jgi:hypothetical protein
MLAFINFIILLLYAQSIDEKIEDISKIINFELINHKKFENFEMDIDSDYQSIYIYPNNISFIKNILINGENYSALISTNLSDSVYISKSNETESENCAKDYTKLQISNSQFDFQGCGPYNVTIAQDQTELNQPIYQIIETNKNNSKIGYDSILALSSLESTSMVIIDYIDNNIKIIEDNLDDNQKQIFKKSLENMIKCEPTGGIFSCKIDYILFGMEKEKDDPFLAKEIPESEGSIAYFDNLSTYSIFPYTYLNYFLTSFFSKYNDECRENNVKGTTLYYITCSRKKIEIFSYARNMSIIINNYSFPLKNLFEDFFKLTDNLSPELIYFNILFNKSSNDFIFGTNFFLGKKIGYNFLDNSTYIYDKNCIDFTSNFSGGNSSTFTFLLYTLTIGLFSCLLILSSILNWLHTRQVNKELENMLKS